MRFNKDLREITRTYNKDERVRRYLADMFDRDIEFAERELASSGMHDQWFMNNLYYEGYQLPPPGTVTNIRDELIKSNQLLDSGRIDSTKFRVKKDEKNFIYVIDNRIADVVDGKDSEFADANREFIVKTDANDRNNRIEKAVQRALHWNEERHQVWKQHHFPAIQQKHRLGLWWIQTYWNPYINLDPKTGKPRGDIEWRQYHPRDVLIDPVPELKYFLDARYIIPKVRLPIDDAREYLYTIAGINPEDVKSDNDYFHHNCRNRQ